MAVAKIKISFKVYIRSVIGAAVRFFLSGGEGMTKCAIGQG